VLRRWQRQRESIGARLDRDVETRSAHPRWLIDTLTHDWPERVDAILAADNAPSPPMLRVNARRTTQERMLAMLADAGVEARPHAFLRDGIMLATNTDVTRLPGFTEGHFSVQDGAAQCAADLLDLRDGLRVLDACAAPGGKACHILERADVRLVALDADARRTGSIRANFERLGLRGDVKTGDAGEPAQWWDGRPFDRILLDAPCSATGVIRRHPDIKLHRRAGDVAPLAAEQRRLLGALWPLLTQGGRLVYGTCSLLRDENERIVEDFLSTQPDAHAVAADLPVGHAAGPGRQILPGEGGLDGMFYTVIAKR
jgi:16S rRNA (cytosine967-C5)-methyltransferase